MTIAPTLFEATRLRTPRPTAHRPVPDRPVAPGDLVSVPSEQTARNGVVGGIVTGLYGPDGKGNGPRVAFTLHGKDRGRVVPLDLVIRHAKPDELIEDFFAAKAPIVVIPCGAQKLDSPAPAGMMYVGQQHRLARQAADTLARNLDARVLILSAKYGLLDLDTVIEPYDMTIGHPDAVTSLDVARQLIGMDARTIIALTPRDYTALLRGRVGTRVEERLAGTSSIFEQRSILAKVKDGECIA